MALNNTNTSIETSWFLNDEYYNHIELVDLIACGTLAQPNTFDLPDFYNGVVFKTIRAVLSFSAIIFNSVFILLNVKGYPDKKYVLKIRVIILLLALVFIIYSILFCSLYTISIVSVINEDMMKLVANAREEDSDYFTKLWRYVADILVQPLYDSATWLLVLIVFDRYVSIKKSYEYNLHMRKAICIAIFPLVFCLILTNPFLNYFLVNQFYEIQVYYGIRLSLISVPMVIALVFSVVNVLTKCWQCRQDLSTKASISLGHPLAVVLCIFIVIENLTVGFFGGLKLLKIYFDFEVTTGSENLEEIKTMILSIGYQMALWVTYILPVMFPVVLTAAVRNFRIPITTLCKTKNRRHRNVVNPY